MSYRSIIKEFDNAVVTENQKLRDIYAKLLAESGCCECGDAQNKTEENIEDTSSTTTESCDVAEDEKGTVKDKPHNNGTGEINQVKGKPHLLHISAQEFFTENEDDVTPVDQDTDGSDTVEPTPQDTPEDNTGDLATEDDDTSDKDGQLLSAKEFFATDTQTPPEEDSDVEPPESTTSAGDDDDTSDVQNMEESDKHTQYSDKFGNSGTGTVSEGLDDEISSSPETEKTEEEPVKKESDKLMEFCEECDDAPIKKEEPTVTEKTEEDDDKAPVEPVTEATPETPEEPQEPADELEESEELRDLRESMEAIKLFTKASRRFNG